MRLLVDHLRVHPVHRREVVHELALLLGHVRQHLALLVRGEEVREALLDERAELGVCARERCEVVGVCDLVGGGAGVAVGADAEGFGEEGVPPRDRAFVGAFELLAGLAAGGV